MKNIKGKDKKFMGIMLFITRKMFCIVPDLKEAKEFLKLRLLHHELGLKAGAEYRDQLLHHKTANNQYV